MCVCVRFCWGRCVDASLTHRGVRLTSCGRDVDVNTDLWDSSSLQRGNTGVRAEVCEFQVYDVQVGGPRGDVRVCLCDDHSLWAPQGTPILQPAKRQLLRRSRLHLGHSGYCYLCCINEELTLIICVCTLCQMFSFNCTWQDILTSRPIWMLSSLWYGSGVIQNRPFFKAIKKIHLISPKFTFVYHICSFCKCKTCF